MKITTWLGLIILVLIGYSTFITYKYNHSKPEIVTNTVVVPGDTIYTYKTIYKSIPYKVIERDTQYRYIDSTHCVNDYDSLFTKYASIKYSKDTLQNDSSATIIIGTKISRNNIDSLGLAFKNNRVKVINESIVTYTNSTPLLSIGLIGGYQTILPYIQYNINSKVGVNGGYNLYNKSINVGINYTLISNKKK
jgi:hypothetical protein